MECYFYKKWWIKRTLLYIHDTMLILVSSDALKLPYIYLKFHHKYKRYNNIIAFWFILWKYMCTCINLCTVVLIQLRLSTELHKTRAVGHWLCDSRGPNLTDHSSEQVSLSGSAGRPEGRIVSYLPFF